MKFFNLLLVVLLTLGSATLASAVRPIQPEAVPEPSSIGYGVLVLAAFGLIALRRYLRTRKQQAS